MLKSFTLEGIPGLGRVSANLNPDMNILTGRNGSGKTTVLKMLWYLTSGNIEEALSEIPFTSATVETDELKISIKRNGLNVNLEISADGAELAFERIFDEDGDLEYNDLDDADSTISIYGSSIFLPTFRRIEGGFTLRTPSRPRTAIIQNRARGTIDEALSDLSRKLSNHEHLFVASLSTGDIVNVLQRKYNEITEISNKLQTSEADAIISKIKQHKVDKAQIFYDNNQYEAPSAENLIDEIQASIEFLEQERTNLFAPLGEINTIIISLFQKKGISLGQRVSFGDTAHAISSDLLSAGEKQMLSFLCYNALRDRSVLFIDEPELSLHVDWQRQLFPILMKQKASNQFLIATHSPFIYSKYPEKEIILSEDKGE